MDEASVVDDIDATETDIESGETPVVKRTREAGFTLLNPKQDNEAEKKRASAAAAGDQPEDEYPDEEELERAIKSSYDQYLELATSINLIFGGAGPDNLAQGNFLDPAVSRDLKAPLKIETQPNFRDGARELRAKIYDSESKRHTLYHFSTREAVADLGNPVKRMSAEQAFIITSAARSNESLRGQTLRLKGNDYNKYMLYLMAKDKKLFQGKKPLKILNESEVKNTPKEVRQAAEEAFQRYKQEKGLDNKQARQEELADYSQKIEAQKPAVARKLEAIGTAQIAESPEPEQPESEPENTDLDVPSDGSGDPSDDAENSGEEGQDLQTEGAAATAAAATATTALAVREDNSYTPEKHYQAVTSEVKDILNDITADTFPDHKWEAYGSATDPDHVNYRLVASDDAIGYRDSEVSREEFQILSNAFSDIGVTSKNDGLAGATDMRLQSYSVSEPGNARPRIDNADLVFLRENREALAAAVSAQALEFAEGAMNGASPVQFDAEGKMIFDTPGDAASAASDFEVVSGEVIDPELPEETPEPEDTAPKREFIDAEYTVRDSDDSNPDSIQADVHRVPDAELDSQGDPVIEIVDQPKALPVGTDESAQTDSGDAAGSSSAGEAEIVVTDSFADGLDADGNPEKGTQVVSSSGATEAKSDFAKSADGERPEDGVETDVAQVVDVAEQGADQTDPDQRKGPGTGLAKI